MALAELHRRLAVDATVTIRLVEAGHWPARRTRDTIEGAGFDAETDPDGDAVRCRRLLTLPDTVGAGMKMLVCGLNPSVYAAEQGVGFARPGNRFWPAALRAGIVTVDRDPDHALQVHGVGMTDMVKRSTPRAAELDDVEYQEGFARLERLVDWLAPAIVCVVGLAGWRAVTDRKAGAGMQVRTVGGRPVYVMPSTSGLNAHAQIDDLTEHLRSAWAGA